MSATQKVLRCVKKLKSLFNSSYSFRTFDLKNLGRIKTVYPKAYTFRQEKGLPCFGGKTAGYQLTVEANLEDKQKGAHLETYVFNYNYHVFFSSSLPCRLESPQWSSMVLHYPVIRRRLSSPTIVRFLSQHSFIFRIVPSP